MDSVPIMQTPNEKKRDLIFFGVSQLIIRVYVTSLCYEFMLRVYVI
jgi:hypothetical protein